MRCFLICGLGSIGRRHLRNLRALGEQHIVLLRSGKSTLPDDELAGLPVETELETALARWRPHAVIVATPTALHLETAIPAVRAGCHVLLEKPVSHSMTGIEDLQRAARMSRSRILVGFQFRFHPGLQRVKTLLEEGAIGLVTGVRAHWGEYLPEWHPWEDYRLSYSARSDLGGGPILTLSHPFDYLSWLFGKPSSVWARAARLSQLELDVEDTAEIALLYSSGLTASLHLDFVQRPRSHWLTVIGTEGTIEWDGLEGVVRCFSANTGAWQVFPPPAGFERNDMFLAEMRHFLELMEGQVDPVCSLDDGLFALRLSLAAIESSATGETVTVAG